MAAPSQAKGTSKVYPTVYGFWTNKGGVGKTFLTFHMATTYAKLFPDKAVVAIDMSPQCDLSATLLTGTQNGVRDPGDTIVTQMQENKVNGSQQPKTVLGYLARRLSDTFGNPSEVDMIPADYLIKCNSYNPHVPGNMWLVCGDNFLDQLVEPLSKVAEFNPTAQGNSFKIVHYYLKNFIEKVVEHFSDKELVVFIDTSPAFSIYTQIALCAMTQLVIPVSSDTFSVQAIINMYQQVYGLHQTTGRANESESGTFAYKVKEYGMKLPRIAAVLHNRIPVVREKQNEQPDFPAAYMAMGAEQTTSLHKGYLDAKQKGDLERIFKVTKAPGGTIRVHHTKEDFANAYLATFRDTGSAGVASMCFGIPNLQQCRAINNFFWDPGVRESACGLTKDMIFAMVVLLRSAWNRADPSAKVSMVAAAGIDQTAVPVAEEDEEEDLEEEDTEPTTEHTEPTMVVASEDVTPSIRSATESNEEPLESAPKLGIPGSPAGGAIDTPSGSWFSRLCSCCKC